MEDRLGVLIFQFSMPVNEVQGFCYTDFFPFAIVTNSNHSYTSRIFTIFHELAHILHQHSGMCLYENATVKQTEEWECNSFAGNFLAPSTLIKKTDDLTQIAQYAARLNISREVYLRRMKEENKVSEMKYFSLLNQIKATYKTAKKKTGFVKPEVKSKASRGETFFNMVLEGMYNNRISYTEASNALNLNISRLMNEI